MPRIITVIILIYIAVVNITSLTMAQDIEYLNSLYWTSVRDVAVRGDIAYCCFSTGLVIIDISNIEEPTFISRLYTAGNNRKIEVLGDYVYIYGNHDRLRIFDISDSENPQYVSEIAVDAEVGNIKVDNNFIYAAAGYMGMLIIDISDPYAPEIITSYDTDGDTESIDVIDTLVFLGERRIYDTSKSFQIFNAADPYNPVRLGYLSNDLGWNKDLVVDGDYAYLANTYRGLIVIDISSLINPTIIAQLEDITYPSKLCKQGDYIFIDSCYSRGPIMIYDVSDPESPELAGHYVVDGSPMNFDLSGEQLFVAGPNGGMLILDVSDLEDINLIAGYETPGVTNQTFIVGDYLYTGESQFGLNIHELSDPVNPNRVSQYELPSYYYKYLLTDTYLYALGGDGLVIIDITNPSAPGNACFHEFDRNFSNICIKEPYIYLAAFQGGIFVYERISQDSLEYVRSFVCNDYSFDVEIDDNIGYFSQCFALNIFDISNPEDSVLLSSISPYSGAGLLYLNDNIIYTQCDDGQRSTSLSLIDVSDPENPLQIDSMIFANSVYNIYFNNNLAYFSIYPNKLIIYDISDPYLPIYICDYRTPSFIQQVASVDEYIYVADNTCLIILRFTPTGIEQVAEIPMQLSLSPNYPNPFNGSTTIQYNLPKASDVTLDIFDILGRKVNTLLDQQQQAGYHQIIWKAEDLSSGFYFYRLTAGSYSQTKKMLLIK